jgi:hypothetical protein
MFAGQQTTGDLIVNGAIDGKTITGAIIATSASASTGITLDGANNNITAYDGSHNLTFILDGNTGNLTSTGTFQTSLTGTRAMMWDHGGGIAALDLYADTGTQHGTAFTQTTSGGTNGGYVTQFRHYTTATNWTSSLSLFADQGWWIGSSTAASNISGTSGGNIYFAGQLARSTAANATFSVGVSGQSQLASGTFTATYSSPVATGTRTVFASPDAAAAVSGAVQSATASGHNYFFNSVANASVSYRFLAIWTN